MALRRILSRIGLVSLTDARKLCRKMARDAARLRLAKERNEALQVAVDIWRRRAAAADPQRASSFREDSVVAPADMSWERQIGHH